MLVELAEQIEEIVGNVFAQGFVIDGAQRTTDDIGLVMLAILGGPCAALVTLSGASPACLPLNLNIPLARSRIAPT